MLIRQETKRPDFEDLIKIMQVGKIKGDIHIRDNIKLKKIKKPHS